MEIRNASYTNCTLCPRRCEVDRSAILDFDSKASLGFCGQTSQVTLARAALHFWEEPCISGTAGSGAVFFCGCNLRCVFCQNADLSNSKLGKPVSITRLADIFLELEQLGATNINLVTASHFVPQIAEAISIAKDHKLSIPVVYNTGTYEFAASLKLLDGLVDIYMPDLKYMDSDLAKKLSFAPDYFEIATKAIDEMYRQVGEPKFDSKSSDIPLMKKGVLVRHLVLPKHTKDSRNILKYLHDKYGDNIYISIMNQYTPMPGIEQKLPDMTELHKPLSETSYNRVIDYAIELGISNAFIQEGPTCKESFIPVWDYTGL